MEKEYISEKQLCLLVIGFTVGTSILLVPTMSIDLARQDAWLSPLLAVVPGFLLVAVLVTLNKMYPGQSLVQYSVSIMGLPGKLAGLLMIWFALHLSALVLRNIGNFVSTVMLFETPSPLIHAAVASVAAFGIRLGIECIARAISLLVPVSIAFFLLIQAFTTQTSKFANLVPVLSEGMLPVIRAGIGLSTFPVGEIVLFSMLIYHVKTTGKKGVLLAAGLLLGMLILTLSILRTITILGPYLSARASYSVFIAVNSGGASNLLQPLLVLNWFTFTIAKFFVAYYAFVTGVAHWSNLPDYKPLVLPAGALITVFSLYVYTNIVQELTFATQIWPVYAMPIEYGIPLLLLVVALLKKA